MRRASTATSSSRDGPSMSIATNKLFTQKNTILANLTQAIQQCQRSYLETNQRTLTNSDYCVHELCQQFDNLFLFGLKKLDKGYWDLVLEFTHRNTIEDLKKLLNVRTYFGLGRAWIYSALNDGLMESYLKCLLENRRVVLRWYVGRAGSLFGDEQSVSVLITLVSGLENVEFKMFSDVPYLDHSCWPTHFNTKRQVVDSILNASSSTLSQISANLNNNSPSEALSEPNLDVAPLINNKTSNKITITKTLRKPQKPSSILGTSANSAKLIVNNISFDAANATALDGDSLSTCGSESGRFTNTNNTGSPSNSDDNVHTLKKSNEHLSDQCRGNKEFEDDYEDNMHMEDKTGTSLEETFRSLNRVQSTSSIDYENEINKLRQENRMNIENKLLIVANKKRITKKKHQSITESPRPASVNSNQDRDLAESSLTISKSFDIKLEHLENSLKKIEHATQNMDACVNDMTTCVYQSYDEKLCNESHDTLDEFGSSDLHVSSIRKADVANAVLSVYDAEPEVDGGLDGVNENEVEDISLEQNHFPNSGLEDTVSMSSLNSELQLQHKEDATSFKSLQSVQSTASMLDHSDYLAKFIASDEVKQEIRVDNNTKLMIMIEIFEHGEEEKLVKFYHASRGHSQGEIEPINLLISSCGLYILIKNKITSPVVAAGADEPGAYRKEAFIHQKEIDYVEVALEAQAVHLVCINKRKSCWITFACRNLTEHFIQNLQTARQMNTTLKPSLLSVFREATQQKMSIKKFIASEENTTNAEVELKSYSLVFWEDQASSQKYMIHKEGVLWFFNKSSSSGVVWKKAYFVLKNDVLTKYKNATDKRPLQVIKLNGEDFAGCRRNTTLSKANTIELILSNANAVYLSAKTAGEASDWLQCFCKIISLGNQSDHSNSPFLPCCSIITTSRCYFCHEDLNSGFYRLLESIKFEEINRISFDNQNPYFCILHDDTDPSNKRFWFVYFMDELERNTFISRFKDAWDALFQVALNIERCQSSETRKRCMRSIQLLHQEWRSAEDV